MSFDLVFQSPTRVIYENALGDQNGVSVYTFDGTGLEVDADGLLTAGTVQASSLALRMPEGAGTQALIPLIEQTGLSTDVSTLGDKPVTVLSLTTVFALIRLTDHVPEDDITDYYPLIHSVSGEESLIGDASPNAFLGGEDLINLQGLDGNDVLIAAADNARLDGGRGNDTLEATGDGATLLGGAGADELLGGAGRQVLNGQAGDDLLIGGTFNQTGDTGDLLIGGRGDDTLRGYSGDDTLFGGPGDDVLLAREGADRVNAGGGRDVMTFQDGTHSAAGGAGGDAFVIYVNLGAGPGTGFAVDRLTIFDFDADVDVMVLGSNDKTFLTAEMAYEAFALNATQQGANTVFDNGETTIMLRDVALTDMQVDNFVRFVEGEADGWANWGTSTLRGLGTDDSLHGTSGADTILAGLGDDDVRAGEGDDRVLGMGGNDVLRGGFGDDLLSGAQGRDVLMAERGNDVLFGGADADAFVLFLDPGEMDQRSFWETDVTERAVIADFNPDEDVLWIRETANGYTQGQDRFADFLTHATQRGSHVAYDDGFAEVLLLNTDLTDLGAEHFLGDGVGFYYWAEMG